MRPLGNVLILLGVLALGYAGLWQLGLAPGSRVTVPPPVFREAARAPTPASAPPPTAAPVPAPAATPLLATPLPLAAADRVERREQATAPEPGYAVRLAIPAIKLETVVQQGGVVEDSQGNPIWETLPFVAVHYGDLTARVGAPGNAVIAGHVVTLNEGNVFRFLYQLDYDDRVEVWDDRDVKREFRVVDVKLVPPTDISVMAATPDVTLTLITCGGSFDPIKREFSERLIVTTKPVASDP